MGFFSYERKKSSDNSDNSNEKDEDQFNNTDNYWKNVCIKTSIVADPSIVKWKQIKRLPLVSPPEREGHCMAKLGHNRLVLTGGYTPDDNVYVLDVCDCSSEMKLNSK